MRILIATPDFPLWDGGIATVAFEVAQSLTRLGHHVVVMAPQQDEKDLVFDATLPFTVCRVRNIKSRLLRLYYHRYALIRLVSRYRIDLVMAQTWFPCGTAALLALRKRGVPFTLTVHGNEILNPKFAAPGWQKLMAAVFSSADRIYCVSRCTADKALAMLPDLPRLAEKITVIYNGVDPSQFIPAPEDPDLISRYGLEGKKVILTLARLVERKGQDMLIKALPLIKESCPDVKYVICGKGPYEAKLRELAIEQGVVDDVVFAGFVSNEDRVKFYNLCDIYAMPSREIVEHGDVEGFGITYLEANACAKAVIGGKSGGVSDAIVDGVTGVLVDPAAPTEIAAAAVRLLSDPLYATRLGEQGRCRVVEEFSWDGICRSMVEN
ncbi:MAG TPA: glycosyltransferase family 4 protein [Geobacteraceae bacterium]